MAGAMMILRSPYQVAANTALRGERVIYVDTEGSFMPRRRFGPIHNCLHARQVRQPPYHWLPSRISSCSFSTVAVPAQVSLPIGL